MGSWLLLVTQWKRMGTSTMSNSGSPGPGDSLLPIGVVQNGSVFDRTTLAEIANEIRAVYLGDSRPWVVGFSGGKDSTAALQLDWYALRDLSPDRRVKPVYVIASDTLVETPVIVQRIDGILARINEAATVEGMPFQAHKVQPTVQDSFWVNLIGKGYPAPTNKFRWCTERLKIKPANRFILDRVAEFGEVVMVLGVRSSESATRAQVMSLHRREGSKLARHSQLPNAYVYPPIQDWSTQDIWAYLLQVESPWGQDNRDLVSLYNSAQAGECPLVIDKTTPSCGNSRFGCWVCTVVSRDKSMEALIDSGEFWLEPLLEFRDFLSSTQEPENKILFRDIKRRDGSVKTTRSGRLSVGPYTFEACKDMLRRVLEVQKSLRIDGPDPESVVISHEELQEIRRIWQVERQDWEDCVPRIYRDVVGEELDWSLEDASRFTRSDRELLDDICGELDISSRLVAKLLDIERDMIGLGRRSTIFKRIDSAFREEWRGRGELELELLNMVGVSIGDDVIDESQEIL